MGYGNEHASIVDIVCLNDFQKESETSFSLLKSIAKYLFCFGPVLYNSWTALTLPVGLDSNSKEKKN